MAFLRQFMGHDGDSSEEEEEVALLEHEGGSSSSEELGEEEGRGFWRATEGGRVLCTDLLWSYLMCAPLQMMTARGRGR